MHPPAVLRFLFQPRVNESFVCASHLLFFNGMRSYEGEVAALNLTILHP